MTGWRPWVTRGGRLVPAAAGLAAAVALTAALAAVRLPVRTHLSGATSALAFVVPVVVGVAIGGFPVGVAAVGIGFLTYDALFIPPYGTLDVSAAQDWVALGVYAAAMLVVARVVAAQRRARAEARQGEDDTRRLFEVSDLLIGDRPLPDLLHRVVETVCQGFGMASVTLLLPEGAQLAVAAQAGTPPPARLPTSGSPLPSQGTPLAQIGRGGTRTLPLATADRPVGLLVLTGPALGARDQHRLAIYANHAALAVERARLRESALRGEVLAEVDAWRRTLLGSVAHDLRTPLASIKAAVSDLADPTVRLSTDDRDQLLATVDGETDRLTRLVTNLLDVHRIEAGTLTVSRRPEVLADLVEEALDGLRPQLEGHPVAVDVPSRLLVEVDATLIVQALTNLLDNAARHTPAGTPVRLRAAARAGTVALTVVDDGPGIEAGRVARLFGNGSAPDLSAAPGAIGTGVGLTIARTFVEANGGSLTVDAGLARGLGLLVSLPASPAARAG